jgi:branched-chain amino acid transport system substrate-binding protein
MNDGRLRTDRARKQRINGRIGRIALAVATAVSLVLAAVGVAVPAAQAAPSPSGAPIVIGNVGTYTMPGAGSSINAPGSAPIKAWAKWVNAHGGINGHPVKLIVDDDQNNQALAVSDVQQMVQQDHVVAFVSNQEGSLNTGYASYLDQHKIPVLGGNIYTLTWDSDPMFFPQGVTAIEGEQAAVTYAKQLGIKKIGSLACSEAAQCSAANSLLKGLADKGGLDDVYLATASSTAPDYTANCLAAKSAGVQLFELLVPSADEGVKIADDCARQNYHPGWIIPAEAIGPGYLTTSSFNNAFNFSGTQPWYSTAPAMNDYHAAMKKYTNINFSKVEEPLTAPDAWASGLMLQKAVQLSGATGVPTSADILAGLAKFKNQTLGGVTGPLTFTDPESKVANCFFVTQIKKQKFVQAGKGTYLCNPTS